MDLKPDQKNAVIIASLAIVILGGITIFNLPRFRYKDTTDYAALQKQDEAKQKAYQQYLQSLHPDPEASKKLFEKLITPEDVRKQVEASLDVTQKVIMPTLADNQIFISTDIGKSQAVGYLTAVGRIATEYDNKILGTSKELFRDDGDPGAIGQAVTETNAAIQQLRQLPVPADLAKFHKANILALQHYRDLVSIAKQYNLSQIENPWPAVYRDYEIINAQTAALDAEFNAADKKYQLASLAVPLAESDGPPISVPFIHTAQAQIGGGVVIVGNPYDAIKEGIKQGLASAFASFATKFLDRLITTIEANYHIANFLYYSDALVKGEYVDDYLAKYVTNPIDQQIVKRFIPQFGCGGNQQELQKLFQAKAQDYLGFDLANVDPTDPDFYAKMAKGGDFFASPQGWELYYKDVASQVQSEAQHAADLEITSPGLKSARDLVNNQIKASLSSINNAEAAAYVSVLNLGVVNVENIVSKVVSSITTSLFNKFIFSGAIVFTEQETCIPIPQLQPVIPVAAVEPQNGQN